MTLVLVIVVLAVTALVTASVASFRIGRTRGVGEIFHIRIEAAQARRRMHDLIREAFIAMVETAEQRRHPQSED
jgi:hypothetical protein